MKFKRYGKKIIRGYKKIVTKRRVKQFKNIAKREGKALWRGARYANKNINREYGGRRESMGFENYRYRPLNRGGGSMQRRNMQGRLPMPYSQVGKGANVYIMVGGQSGYAFQQRKKKRVVMRDAWALH